MFCSSSSGGTAWFLSSCRTEWSTCPTCPVEGRWPRGAGPGSTVSTWRQHVGQGPPTEVCAADATMSTPGTVPGRGPQVRGTGRQVAWTPWKEASRGKCSHPHLSRAVGRRCAGRGCLELGGAGGVELRAPRGRAGAADGNTGHGESAATHRREELWAPDGVQLSWVLRPVWDPLPESAFAPRLLSPLPVVRLAEVGLSFPGQGPPGPHDSAASQTGSGPLFPPPSWVTWAGTVPRSSRAVCQPAVTRCWPPARFWPLLSTCLPRKAAEGASPAPC